MACLNTYCFIATRSDDINELYAQLKPKNEKMAALQKDVLVLNMLLDGTLPDDMKQQGIHFFVQQGFFFYLIYLLIAIFCKIIARITKQSGLIYAG